MAVELVVAIIANLIVFLSLLALLNSFLGWMGELVGQTGWSFEASFEAINLRYFYLKSESKVKLISEFYS